MQSSDIKPTVLFLLTPRVYILENTPPPRGVGISADVIWGKKYEKGKRKRWKMLN
jgi:hypothetical protein